MIPHDAARAATLPALFRPMTAHVLRCGTVTVVVEGDVVVGAIAWLPSTHAAIPPTRSALSAFTVLRAMRGADLALFGERGPALDKAAKAARPTTPHTFLVALGVSPEAQSSGVGSALVRDGLAAIPAGRVYLECEEHLVTYDARFGFAEHVRIDPGGGVPVQIGMLRGA